MVKMEKTWECRVLIKDFLVIEEEDLQLDGCEMNFTAEEIKKHVEQALIRCFERMTKGISIELVEVSEYKEEKKK